MVMSMNRLSPNNNNNANSNNNNNNANSNIGNNGGGLGNNIDSALMSAAAPSALNGNNNNNNNSNNHHHQYSKFDDDDDEDEDAHDASDCFDDDDKDEEDEYEEEDTFASTLDYSHQQQQQRDQLIKNNRRRNHRRLINRNGHSSTYPLSPTTSPLYPPSTSTSMLSPSSSIITPATAASSSPSAMTTTMTSAMNAKPTPFRRHSSQLSPTSTTATTSQNGTSSITTGRPQRSSPAGPSVGGASISDRSSSSSPTTTSSPVNGHFLINGTGTALEPIKEQRPFTPTNSYNTQQSSSSPSPTTKMRNKVLSPNLTRHGSLMLDGHGSNSHTINNNGGNNGTMANGFLAPCSRNYRDGNGLSRSSFRTPDFLRNRLSSRRVRNRLVQKHGECNISLVNVPKQRRKYFSDIFTTLVEVKWRWCLLVFALGFLLSWLFFSVLYWLVVVSHGDFSHVGEEGWEPCVDGATSYLSLFIFSVVSQHTIGYGKRYPTEKCPEILLLICIQSMVGVMIQTLMAGVVFAKIARPKKRAETLIFSKNAVICMRDSQLCFLFRVGDMRKSQLAEAHIRLQMIKKRITAEGELLPFHQFDMDIGYDTGQDRIFVVWPITICHVIDQDSPLYSMSAEDLKTSRFEIIVILEGVVQSVGSCTQAKTSYLPSEVMWGHRFEKLVTYQRDNGEYRIDFSRFHNVHPIQMPTCSAKTLNDMRDAGLKPEMKYQCERIEDVENMGVTPYGTIQPPPQIIRPSVLPLPKAVRPRMRDDLLTGGAGGHSGVGENRATNQQVGSAATGIGQTIGAGGIEYSDNKNFELQEQQPKRTFDSNSTDSTVIATDSTTMPRIIIQSPSDISLRQQGDQQLQRHIKKNNVLRQHDIM